MVLLVSDSSKETAGGRACEQIRRKQVKVLVNDKTAEVKYWEQLLREATYRDLADSLQFLEGK